MDFLNDPFFDTDTIFQDNNPISFAFDGISVEQRELGSSLEQITTTPSPFTEDYKSETFSSPDSLQDLSDCSSSSSHSTPLNNTESTTNVNRELLLPPSLSFAQQTTLNPNLITEAFLLQNQQQLEQLKLLQQAFAQQQQQVIQRNNMESPIRFKSSSSSSSTSSITDSSKTEQLSASQKRKRENEEKLDQYSKRLEELNRIPSKNLTEEEKEEKRKLRNRLSAKKSRETKKTEQEFTHAERECLLQKNRNLEQKVAEYEQEISKLQSIITQLKTRLSSYEKDFIFSTNPLDEEEPSMEPTPKRFKTHIFVFLLCFTVLLFPLATIWNLNQQDSQNNNAQFQGFQIKNFQRTLKEASESSVLARAPSLSSRQSESKLPNCTLQDKISEMDKYYIEDEHCSFVDTEEHFNLNDFDKKIVTFPQKAKNHFVFSHSKSTNEKTEEQPSTTIHSKSILRRKNASKLPQQTNSSPKILDSHQQEKPRLDLIPVSQQNPFAQAKDMETGVIYSFYAEKKEEDGETVISLFAPFAYPLLDAAKKENSSGEKKKVRLEIYVPQQENLKVFKNQDDLRERIIRLLQIKSDNIEFGEAYFAFNPSTPITTTTTAERTNSSNSE